MSREPEKHLFCWVELASKNAQAAQKFYGKLFDWSFQEMTFPGGSYFTAKVKDDSAAGLFTMPPEMSAMNIPPHWASYVLVDNCDESVKKAVSLGAKVLKDSFDVMDAGRMAVLQDPCGAVISLWQKGKVVGASATGDEQGGFCWQELIVPEPKKALDFYTALFGWAYETHNFDDTTYHSLKNSKGEPFGGIMATPKGMPIPPHWGVYFTVNSLKDGMDYVKANGGQIFVGPQDVHGMGKFAICQDPEGAVFAIFEFTHSGECGSSCSHG